MISIVVPLYNKSNSIERTLQSILDQHFFDFELIIVDDGSTDGSADVVGRFIDQRITLVSQPNKGVSAARNFGIQQARYNFIALLDADDTWEPDYLVEMARMIECFPDAGLYGCAYDKMMGGIAYLQNFKLPTGFVGYVQPYYEQARKHPLFWTSAVVLNRSIIEDTGFFDESIHFGEDIDLWMRVASRYQVAFCNEVLVHYNLDGENRVMKNKIPYEKSLLSRLDNYREMEQESASFRRYLNKMRIQFIPELFLHYEITETQLREYIEDIDVQDQTIKHRLFLVLPFYVQKMIIGSLYAHLFS